MDERHRVVNDVGHALIMAPLDRPPSRGTGSGVQAARAPAGRLDAVTDPAAPGSGRPEDSADETSRPARQAARERAEELRRLQRRTDRRRLWIVRGGVLGGIALVLGVVAVVLLTMVQPAGRGPANMASDGIRLIAAEGGEGVAAERTRGVPADGEPTPSEPTGGDAVDIRIYVDYLSPTAGEFERVNGEQIRAWVEQGIATVEIHPIAMLTNRSAGTQYSLRSANAAACVAQAAPDAFLDFNRAMLLDQPEEGQAGFENAELVRRAADAGADGARVRTCIDGDRFRPWVQAATTRALNGPLPDTDDVAAVTETPTVLVDGTQYPYVAETDPAEFARFIVQIGGSAYNVDPTPTPTPEPEETEPADEG
jgi:hypothetical protein